MADNPTPVDLTEQRSEAIAELVKALLIINGGGAVALLAFLQSAWVRDNRLIVSVACAVGFSSVRLVIRGCLSLVSLLRILVPPEKRYAVGTVQALVPAFCVGFTIRIC